MLPVGIKPQPRYMPWAGPKAIFYNSLSCIPSLLYWTSGCVVTKYTWWWVHSIIFILLNPVHSIESRCFSGLGVWPRPITSISSHIVVPSLWWNMTTGGCSESNALSHTPETRPLESMSLLWRTLWAYFKVITSPLLSFAWDTMESFLQNVRVSFFLEASNHV